MLRNKASNDKKIALEAQKERLLQEIKYYEKRMEEFPKISSSDYYGGNSSSDSEDDFPIALDIGPSISELKLQDRLLRTCLQATQELTGVGVLQSEVNVMVEDPIIEGEKPVEEPGSWREVTAECRIDLVPFSITFFTHQPSRKFAPSSYRGLRVLPVKTAHEVELSKSVLAALTNPSDAIEVLRSYASAHRSRRSTLARLADRYATSLFMEPLAEGGFVLKCANLLKMSWRLDNKLSPVAPFRHKMNFELEYMDELYLKIIKQAHRQLSDPSLQTDERTLLLAKIISTCLEAQAPTQELYESMESDPESIKKLEKTTLDEDSDEEPDTEPETARKRDEEVMAPPKSIPRKAKPKGKENTDDNRKSVKRTTGQVDGGSVKKARTDDRNDIDADKGRLSVTDIIKQSEVNDAGNLNKGKAINQKSTENVEKKRSSEKVGKPKNSVDTDKSTKVVNKAVNEDKGAGSSKNIAKCNKKVNQNNGNSENNDAPAKKVTKIDNYSKNGQEKSADVEKNSDIVKKNANNDKNIPKNAADPKAVKKVNDIEKKAIQNSKITETAINKVNAKPKNGKNMLKTTDQKTLTANTEKTKNVNPKNSKPIEDNKLKTADSSNKKLEVVANTKKNVNSDTNAKKIVNSDTNGKKSVNSDTNVEKNVNSDTNAKKNLNSDTNAKNSVNSDTNAKKSVNSDTNAMKKSDVILKSATVTNVSTKTKDNLAESSKSKHFDKNSNIQSRNSPKNIASKVTENAKVKNTASTDSDKAKSVATINKIGVANPKKAVTSTKSTDNAPKDVPKNIAVLEISRNPEKTKIIVKNHRSGSGRVTKSYAKSFGANTLKANISSEAGKNSKIPQKKLSPAYAAALKQNPVRISPRMLSKFKSSSGSNVQKLFKPVTNIPRLLKKSVAKSK